MSAAAEDVGSKRRKVDALLADAVALPCLTQLPDAIFEEVIKYLPKPSVAMLAVALSAPSSSWRDGQWRKKTSAATDAIIAAARRQDARYWEILDFEHIDQNAARKLKMMILLLPWHASTANHS